MARTLNDTLIRLFQGSSSNAWGYNIRPMSEKRVYLKIPLNKEIVEIPILTLSDFYSPRWRNKITQYSSLVISLQDYGYEFSYTTLDRIMREALLTNFKSTKLYKVDVKQGEDTITYYVTRGTVFDADYHPIMMLSWELEKQEIEEDTNTPPFNLKRMIIRISPDCYLNKTDPMRRMIANKIVNLVLSNNRSSHVSCNGLINGHVRDMRPVVEIAKCPFDIIHPQSPSPDTSNKELISVALNHVGEIVNDS